MKIFKLSPINTETNNPNGKASIAKSTYIVCAESEKKAREMVKRNTCIAAPRVRGQNVKTSPWTNPELTECIESSNDKYKDITIDKEKILEIVRYK